VQADATSEMTAAAASGPIPGIVTSRSRHAVGVFVHEEAVAAGGSVEVGRGVVPGGRGLRRRALDHPLAVIWLRAGLWMPLRSSHNAAMAGDISI
jgi:hypothetical protein